MKTDLSITYSKINADPAKYLSLFGQEVLNPLPDDSKTMIYSINNIGFIMDLIQANPRSVYYIVGHSLVNAAVKSMFEFESGRIFFYAEESADPINIFKEINMKFDRIVMNPPWGDKKTTGIAQAILEAAMSYSKEVVCLYGENEFFKVANKNRIEQFKHCPEVHIVATNELFGINARMNACLAVFKPDQEFNTFDLTVEENPEWNGAYSWKGDLKQFYDMLYPKAFIDLYNQTKPVWEAMQKASLENGMVNLSNGQFEYFENKLVKKHHETAAVPNSPYKFILNRTSYENVQDPYYDTVKNAGGCTWTCKTERIKNNMLYWLHDSPLTFLWRKYHLYGTVANCSQYKCLPAVDFDRPENEFKEWADSLCDNFGKTHTIEKITKLRFKEQ